MRFNNEQERLAHPWARRIPLCYFESHFDYESFPDKYSTLMQAPIREVLSASNARKLSDLEKTRYLICAACHEPEIPEEDIVKLGNDLGLDLNSAPFANMVLIMGIRKHWLVRYLDKTLEEFKRKPLKKKLLNILDKWHFELILSYAIFTGNLEALKKFQESLPQHMKLLMNLHLLGDLKKWIAGGNNSDLIEWLLPLNKEIFEQAFCMICFRDETIISESAWQKLKEQFEKAMRDKIASYRHKIESLEIESGNFDIDDEDEFCHIKIILYTLIIMNDSSFKNDVTFLSNLPSVKKYLSRNGSMGLLISRANRTAPQEIRDALPVPFMEVVSSINKGEKEIRFRCFKFNENQISGIAKALKEKQDNHIVEIDFANSEMEDNEAVVLVGAIAESTSLRLLDLHGSKFLGDNFQQSNVAREIEKLLENNIRINVKLVSDDAITQDGWEPKEDTNTETIKIKLFLFRNRLHAELDSLSNSLAVGLNCHRLLIEGGSRKVDLVYFDLKYLSSEIVKIKNHIDEFEQHHHHLNDDRHRDLLMDHWLEVVALFHRRSMNVYHRDKCIAGIDSRIIAAENCLASINNKDSIFYKNICHEVGSYYAECVSPENTPEANMEFIKSAFNFWKICINDDEFMASPAGDGFELRCNDMLHQFQRECAVAVGRGQESISDEISNLNVRFPGKVAPDGFDVVASIMETKLIAAYDLFFLLIIKYRDSINSHPSSRLVNESAFFKMPKLLQNDVASSQALDMLYDLMMGKPVDIYKLIEKVKILERHPKFTIGFNRFTSSYEAQLLFGDGSSYRNMSDMLRRSLIKIRPLHDVISRLMMSRPYTSSGIFDALYEQKTSLTPIKRGQV